MWIGKEIVVNGLLLDSYTFNGIIYGLFQKGQKKELCKHLIKMTGMGWFQYLDLGYFDKSMLCEEGNIQ